MTLFRWFCLLFVLQDFLVASWHQPEQIRYFQEPTIPFDWDQLTGDTLYLEDDESGNTAYQFITGAGIPLYYGQDVSTEVCFDNKCRPLHATIYWNITGRYLGYALPPDEYLTSADHEPFTDDQYVQLNHLLADPYLPLGHVSFHELIDLPNVPSDQVDGISGATTSHLADFVVEGAAYTTYTMWNAIYGSMQRKIELATERDLTDTLLRFILNSKSSADLIWGLNRLDTTSTFVPTIEEAILTLLGSDEFSVAHKTIEMIQPVHLQSKSLQKGLFLGYQEASYGLKKPIIQKLMQAPDLSPEVVEESREILVHLNGVQLGYLLGLYANYGVSDLQTQHAVAARLEDPNRFVSDKAYQYLVDQPVQDAVIKKALDTYRQKMP